MTFTLCYIYRSFSVQVADLSTVATFDEHVIRTDEAMETVNLAYFL